MASVGLTELGKLSLLESKTANLKVHERFGDDEGAGPVEGRCDGCRGASNSARKNFSHHEPRDWAEPGRERDDVDHQRHQGNPA
jgi:hypothetical protein